MSKEHATERLEIIIKQPNPVFEYWLVRWLQEAERKKSKSQYQLREALQALRSFPLPLSSGRECSILRGFTAPLCNLIDEELKILKEKSSPQTTILSTPKQYSDAVQEVIKSVQKLKKQRAKPLKPVKLTKAAQKCLAEEEERQRQVTMSPGSFNILLLVDTQEAKGSKKHQNLDQTQNYLDTLEVSYEIRRLTVGDFLWIARDSEGRELVLPYIVERKRMDDFSSSIRDGRFHDQKFRLKNSKIQNIIYLIEDYGDNDIVGIPLETLLQAEVNTQVHNEFIVKHVENHWRAVVYLKTMTTILTKLYKDKVLISTAKEDLQPSQPTNRIVGLLKFRAFNEDSGRSANLTIHEVFIKQLLQLHSLSFEKALAIAEIYPTPRCLIEAFAKCASESEARMLLAKIPCGKMERPVGPRISTTLYNFYMTDF